MKGVSDKSGTVQEKLGGAEESNERKLEKIGGDRSEDEEAFINYKFEGGGG